MALLATTLLAACSKVPDGILSEKKMQGVLTDMLLAEAMVNVDYNTYKSDTMKLGDVQADAAPVSNRDSVDIWPRRSYLVLSPTSVFNGVTFDIRPETNYSSGSSFVLGMRVWGLNNKMAYKPEVRLSADQGDTTLTVNSKITKDGYHETILKTIPTKKVKRVFGYIRMDNMDTTYYIDSLSLMKYNYGKELAELPKDSIK